MDNVIFLNLLLLYYNRSKYVQAYKKLKLSKEKFTGMKLIYTLKSLMELLHDKSHIPEIGKKIFEAKRTDRKSVV